MATQLFGPNDKNEFTSHSVCIEMLFLSLLNIAVALM